MASLCASCIILDVAKSSRRLSSSSIPDREVEPPFKVGGRGRDTLASSARLRRLNSIPTRPSQANDEVRAPSVYAWQLGTRWQFIDCLCFLFSLSPLVGASSKPCTPLVLQSENTEKSQLYAVLPPPLAYRRATCDVAWILNFLSSAAPALPTGW